MNVFKSIFGQKNKAPFDNSALKVDMHSHLIPGIDDGSQSMDHTIGMLLRFVELGYEKVITTPHILYDYYKNTDRKSTRLNSSHVRISYAVFCLKNKAWLDHGTLVGNV